MRGWVSHLGVFRRALVERVGGLRAGLEGSQDYDLALRTAALTDPLKIRHIPAVLYHWRRSDANASFSQAHLDRCIVAARLAVQESLQKVGGLTAKAKVEPARFMPQFQRIRWALPEPVPRVTLIVPTRNHAELLKRCTTGLLHRTDYPDLELLIVDNGSTEAATKALLSRLTQDSRVRILEYPGNFNYSAIINAAVAAATGIVVVLLNNDIDVIDSGWLGGMVSHTIRPDVGAVGAKLLFADNTIQHAGVVLGIAASCVAGHYGIGQPRRAVGDLGQLVLTRDVSAVTGACLAIRKEVFEAAGGLDEKNLPIAFNDVDLCLRIRQQGLRIVFTPYAQLYHLESSSRGSDASPERVERFNNECRYMREQWGGVLDNDPFYSPHFSRVDSNQRLAFPPRRAKPWRYYV
jgi:GT2 family glycosyltransferase